MRLLDVLQDPIPEEFYDNAEEYLEKRRERPKEIEIERSIEDRLEMIENYVTTDVHDLITVRSFRSIPVRLISANEF